MKRTAVICFLLILALLLVGCNKQESADTADKDRDVIYQVSLLQGLTFGDYYGSVTVGELKKNGDIGLGTFDGLNGELVMLDGEVYRIAGDGSVEVVPDDETVPFSNVTFMDADEKRDLKDISDYKSLCEELDRIVEERGKNRFYMIRIDGTFVEANLRSEYAQEEPYEPLVDVLEHDQTFFDYTNIKGTVVGLYCPPYMSSLNATGWHMHFISEDKSAGGHVLGLSIDDAELIWDDSDGFQMLLPQNEMFSGFDLTIDQSEDIEKVESNIKK